MKIGLIGVPGSGKTALAEKLQDKLGSARILDGYVQQLEHKTDYKFGMFATYIGNLNIAFARLNRERQVGINTLCDHIITCGTVVDTIAYMAVDAATTTPFEGWERRMVSSLALAGCLHDDTLDYDVLALLPYPGGDDSFINELDDAMAKTVESFDDNVIVLRDGDGIDSWTTQIMEKMDEPAAAH